MVNEAAKNPFENIGVASLTDNDSDVLAVSQGCSFRDSQVATYIGIRHWP
jgi:hypothetical protein